MKKSFTGVLFNHRKGKKKKLDSIRKVGERWPDALIIRIVKQAWSAQHHVKSFAWIIKIISLSNTEDGY